MARAVASAALSATDLATQDEKDGARRPGIRGKAAGARRRPRFAVAAVAAGLALAVGMGGYAYASGQLVSVASAFDDVFLGSTAPTRVWNKVGRPVDAVATSDGVTISADAIMGDEHNYAVVYSIRRADGKPLGKVGTGANGTLTIDGKTLQADFDQSVDGTSGAGGESYFYDADPGDNAIQMVTKMTTDTSVIGATMRTSFRGITLQDESYHTAGTIATGSWDLKFKLNYQSDSLGLKPAGTLTVAGTGGSVRGVSVSPIGITIDYTVNGTEEAPASGRWSPKYLDLGDITVTMRDGTTMTVPSGAASSSEKDGKTVVSMGSFFNSVIDPGDVASVSFAGVTATA
ncbi:DUF4179 domain-containing protein [Parafannyhessea umbonata]|uniref:DUF4179 domain-containing protein n=1 Tax=Parafannyhessea umbonata TaxID=604330 RepID=UPI003AB68A06